MDISRRRATFFDWFPAPQFLLLATAGIAVTDEDVKFVELTRHTLGGGLKLKHLTRTSGTSVAATLKNIASSYGVRFVNATLPDENTYLFTTSIDKVPQESMRDAVAFIIEENVPVSLSEAVFSYEIIEGSKEAGKIRLAVTVVPKNFINAQIKLFESAGITVVSFDTESQAIARAIIKSGDKRAHLIVNLADNKTGFYVVEKEVVQFSTTLNHASEGASIEDGSVNYLRRASEIKTKIDEVRSFWANNTGNNTGESRPIEKMLLCGLWSNKDDFLKALRSHSDIESARADVWSNASVLRNQVTALPATESVNCVAAIGLALPH